MRAAAAELAQLQQLQQRRQRRIVECPSATAARVQVDGRELVNFCSNDYLGLAHDQRLGTAMAQAAQRWGAGAGAAHLLTGHTREHHELELELAAFTGRESALLFSTGYMANVGVIQALCKRADVVVQDKLNHASLLDGARLSGARLQRYAHADVQQAETLLTEAGQYAALLATDGVFSMDGDLAPLHQLAQLATRHQVLFMVDDAHGLGVVGARGRGTLELAQLDEQQVPLLVGTLGKALGSFGAFVAGPADLIELVMQRARSYIFTTALPAPVAAATRAALRIIDADAGPRQRVQALTLRFRNGAAQLGLPISPSNTPIQPLLLGDTGRCLAASEALMQRGYWVAAIRSPTVAVGTERLRINLSAAHQERDVDGLLNALQEVFAAPGMAG
ncbi:MAG: 8-amino-7-oxononanoate synthase [Pseudomonadota bacterium]